MALLTCPFSFTGYPSILHLLVCNVQIVIVRALNILFTGFCTTTSTEDRKRPAEDLLPISHERVMESRSQLVCGPVGSDHSLPRQPLHRILLMLVCPPSGSNDQGWARGTYRGSARRPYSGMGSGRCHIGSRWEGWGRRGRRTYCQ